MGFCVVNKLTVKVSINSMCNDSNQQDLDYLGLSQCLSFTCKHIHRHTIILFRNVVLALTYHYNQLSSYSGLMLSLFVHVSFWCFSS